MISVGAVSGGVSYGQVRSAAGPSAVASAKTDGQYAAAAVAAPALIVQNAPEQHFIRRAAGVAQQDDGGAQLMESGFIQSHLDRLIESRETMLNSDKYRQLTENQMTQTGDSAWVQDSIERIQEQQEVMLNSDRYKQLLTPFQPKK